MLIDPDPRRCDVSRKGAHGLWVLHPFDAGQGLELVPAELAITARGLWDQVPEAGA